MPPKPKTQNPIPRRILLVRPSALGDVARTVPCLASLRRAYPEATIDWLVDARFADAVRGHPMLDGVVPFDRKRKGAVWPLLRRLRKAKYDLVFDLQGLARSGLFAWATRAPVRVGFANAREMGWLGYNRRHKVDATRHAADRMLALLEAEGIEPVADFSLHVPEDNRGFLESSCNSLGKVLSALMEQPNEIRGVFAVAPTAQWGCKCWPLGKYAELINRYLEAYPDRVVAILAAPSEMDETAKALESALPGAASGRVLYPFTTVGEMMDVIDGADLLVGNDSAPLHLAVGLATPTVSLFGPTDPALVGPPPRPEDFTSAPGADPDSHTPTANPAAALLASGGHRVLRAPSAEGQTYNYRAHRDDDTLISEITVDAVWDAVQSALQP